MRVSTKGRYSLRVLLDLAQRRDEGYVSLRSIAERQGISKKYLDQIMMILNRTDYLKSTRGSHGGYKLARDPDQYTLGGILRLTEGSVAPLACLESGGGDCARHGNCIARRVWQGLQDAIDGYLDNLTLRDMLEQHGGEAPECFDI